MSYEKRTAYSGAAAVPLSLSDRTLIPMHRGGNFCSFLIPGGDAALVSRVGLSQLLSFGLSVLLACDMSMLTAYLLG